MILYGTVGVILIALALLGVKRAGLPYICALGAGGWAFTLAALIGLLALHVVQNHFHPRSGDHRHTQRVCRHDYMVSDAKGEYPLDHLAESSWLRFDGLAMVFAVGARMGDGPPRLTTTEIPLPC